MNYERAWEELKEWLQIASTTYPDREASALSDVLETIEGLEAEHE